MAAFQHPVVNLENKPAGTVDLLPEVFKLEDLNQHLIWEAVRHFLAKRRAGTAKTKDKWEVSGSGKKLWKQKGTGRARVGSIRSPLWKGGGTTHGPHPRSYDYAFPKKARRAALRNALSAKLASGQILVVENWDVASHKTKTLILPMRPGSGHPDRPPGRHRGQREAHAGRRQQPEAADRREPGRQRL